MRVYSFVIEAAIQKCCGNFYFLNTSGKATAHRNRFSLLVLQEVLPEDFRLWSFTNTNDDQDFFETSKCFHLMDGKSQAQIT